MADGDSPAGQGKGQPHRLTRRRALGASAAAAAGASLGGLTNGAALARERRRPIARDGRFAWGVSSGLPTPRAIVVWTRVGGLDRSSQIQLEVARDRQFRNVVERRRVTAQKSRDYTVHALVNGLKPQHEYFYRFSTRNSRSDVGRFRTLPPRRLQRADPDRLLLLPELHRRLLQRPPRARQGGRPRSRRLPRRLHLRERHLRGPAPGPHRRQQRRRRARSSPSTARSTASTSPPPTSRRCTLATRSSPSGTTTRSRTTTPATSPPRAPSPA